MCVGVAGGKLLASPDCTETSMLAGSWAVIAWPTPHASLTEPLLLVMVPSATLRTPSRTLTASTTALVVSDAEDESVLVDELCRLLKSSAPLGAVMPKLLP